MLVLRASNPNGKSSDAGCQPPLGLAALEGHFVGVARPWLLALVVYWNGLLTRVETHKVSLRPEPRHGFCSSFGRKCSREWWLLIGG